MTEASRILAERLDADDHRLGEAFLTEDGALVDRVLRDVVRARRQSSRDTLTGHLCRTISILHEVGVLDWRCPEPTSMPRFAKADLVGLCAKVWRLIDARLAVSQPVAVPRVH